MNNYPKDLGNNRWVIEVKSREGTDELYIELPPDALNQMGWDVGDTIIWTEEDGKWLLTKKVDDEQD